MRNKLNLIILGINIAVLLSIIALLFINNKCKNDTEDIFKDNVNSIVEVKATADGAFESYGSGVIYDAKGYIITNAHVITYISLGEVKEFANYYIRFATKTDYQDATLIKYNTEVDLAILKINDESTTYEAIKFSNKIYTYGDKVYAIGNTSNYGIAISEGIISVPEVNVKYDDISRLVIQADINISAGNSGGALLDDNGEFIGLTTFRTKDIEGNVNYGFAYSIPLHTIKDYIREV